MLETTSKELDKFYTKPEVAQRLIDITCEVLEINKNEQLFLEPSAGAGVFSDKLPNCLAFDIKPENNRIQKADYLELIPTWDVNTIIAIGNPPFGHRAKLALNFLNKALADSRAVAFILPNTFRRWGTLKHINENTKLIYDETLPADSFTLDNREYSVRCCFQIWVHTDDLKYLTKENIRKEEAPPISHPDFELWQFNATPEARKYLDEDWEIALWRQGHKDYSQRFFKSDDYDTVKDIMYNTKLQLFLLKPKTEEARKIVLNEMDFDDLALRNLSMPGFGKADFVAFYLETRQRLGLD